MNNYKRDDCSYAEDKKCRICGLADVKNINIFGPKNYKLLVTKILTVYPIVLYENDPLPKNICKKCIYNVSIMYNDIQRVMKMQTKWINNVRSIQPNHNYIKVIDLIEDSNKATREKIQTTLGKDANEISIQRLLPMYQPEPTTVSKHNIPNDVEIVLKQTSHAGAEEAKECKKTENLTKFKDIKSILESNGCSLVAVAKKKIPSGNQLSSESEECHNTIEEMQTINIKTEPLDEDVIKRSCEIINRLSDLENDEEDDVVLSKIASNISTKKLLQLPSPPPSATTSSTSSSSSATIKCRHCFAHFNTLAMLSIHQLSHLRLELPKLFKKKYLPKHSRRGRLITVQNRKSIRCLNCWRLFLDNKSILDHWTEGECDFYCHLCGKIFADAPKMLREHVPAAHGISYRSSKLPRPRVITKNATYVGQFKPVALSLANDINQKIKPKMWPTQQAEKNLNNDSTVTCNICMKSFQNFKARNSHMRKHKPSNIYGSSMMILSTVGADEYMFEDTHNNDNSYDIKSKTVIKTEETGSSSNTSNQLNGGLIKLKSLADLQNAKFTTEKTVTTLSKNYNECTVKEERMEIEDNHLESAPRSSAIKCSACKEHFETQHKLFRHKRTCPAIFLITCNYCGKSFISHRDHNLHVKQEHNISISI